MRREVPSLTTDSPLTTGTVVYRRPVNAGATTQAREKHAHGELVLQSYFRLPYEITRLHGWGVSMQHSLTGLVLDCAPWKTNPNCPRPRTSGEKRRHLARKRARAARRCGR